ncbi:cytohesin-interacting protein-like [Polypterus senegalus]|uniref:cytohesin-interacting protein-like n=1 Tax=Polypterus senegalus TaxID=55291 RepID=UPI0019662A8F|nr:cytohesin-interacting protein-like [Polypterus senegalus]
MTLRRFIREFRNENYIMGNVHKTRSALYFDSNSNEENDNKQLQNLVTSLGTLPRGRRPLLHCQFNPPTAFPDTPRTTFILEKQDNETFGFEIQTHESPQQSTHSAAFYTFICKVNENSPAEAAGLTTGEIIVNINGISVERSSHQHIVDLIKASVNCLRLETINGADMKRTELEAKLRMLKKSLHEKWVELESLVLKEQRLLQDCMNECSSQGPDSPVYPSACLDPSILSFAHQPQTKQRFSSDSSCVSQLSFMTEGSDDGLYQMCVFEESINPQRRASVDEECLSRRGSTTSIKAHLSRTRSINMVGNGGKSPSWEGAAPSSIFGTLPRKMKRGSVRRQLLKFIPGLNRSVEEEETSELKHS